MGAREYRREWSAALGRDMETLRFGDRGRTLVAFPTSNGRFYQWEDFGIVEALQDRIAAGHFQLLCVDSVDAESWYDEAKTPHDRIQRHLQYERYIVDEVLPRAGDRPLAVGASFGAFHSVLIALRHPTRVGGFIALSGAFDNSHFVGGYQGEDAYFTSALGFLPGLNDDAYLGPIRAFDRRVVATGEEDPNAGESRRLGELLRAKGVEVQLDFHQGWAHDWPYWKEWMRRYA